MKNLIKKNDMIYKFSKKTYISFHKNTYQRFFSLLTDVSPELTSKWLYRRTFNEKLNLDNSKTFSEKITWLKLNTYNNNPLVTQCADKYQVRKYVQDCRLSYLLNNLINVWNSEDEIDWGILPEKFAIKGNHGSGYNIICDDKSNLNIKKTEKKSENGWMKTFGR